MGLSILDGNSCADERDNHGNALQKAKEAYDEYCRLKTHHPGTISFTRIRNLWLVNIYNRLGERDFTCAGRVKDALCRLLPEKEQSEFRNYAEGVERKL